MMSRQWSASAAWSASVERGLRAAPASCGRPFDGVAVQSVARCRRSPLVSAARGAAGGPVLNCAGRRHDLSTAQVMAVLNITPDSFSDGGQLWADGRPRIDAALRRAAAMVAAGAAMLDVGGESTRPEASPVSPGEERDRVLPVVEALLREFDITVSVDSSESGLMREAAALGAGLINDVRALSRPGALAAAAASGLPVCLVHMRAAPATMQDDPRYVDVVTEVRDFLRERLHVCVAAGISPERIVLDPGIGFGKTPAHNLSLLSQLDVLAAEGRALLVGVSRKSVIGHVLGRAPGERLAGGVALAAIAVFQGAHIVRAHDVAETVDAVRMASAVCAARDLSPGAS